MAIDRDKLKREKQYLQTIWAGIHGEKEILNIKRKVVHNNSDQPIEQFRDINIDDYKIEDVRVIEKIDESILYIDDPSTIKYDKKIIVKNLEKACYISLYEENVNFNLLPQKQKIIINPEYTYEVSIKGKIDIGLKAQIFAIFYSNSSKEEIYQIGLNQNSLLSPSKNIKSMRLALRVEGEGELEIDRIAIKKQKKIEFIGYKNLKKLGYDIPTNIKDLKVACIFDEFTTECYKHACHLIPITPYNWKAQFTVERPHLFFVESAWVGNNGAWTRKVAYTNENNVKELREIIDWCKDNDIPTVFWNKEDPVHYNVFINTAKMFDYIFTTDENKVKDYKKDTNNNNIYPLPFAAQPLIHNPIKIQEERNSKACFAGSYYAVKYPERQDDIDRLLDAAVETMGIEIYDRYFGALNSDFLFPERFHKYIKGNLKPQQLHIANKGYKVMVNVNSVKESPTMFSRRVFEGLASGTPVISSYSEGINNLFYNIVIASDDKHELANELIRLKNDNIYYDKKSIRGIREVLKYHTYNIRLNYIIKQIGWDVKVSNHEISIVIEADTTEHVRKGIERFDAQTYKNKKLVFLIRDNQEIIEIINMNKREDISFIYIDYHNEKETSLEELIHSGYIAILNLDNYYGSYYIEDLMLATEYIEAEVIGKFAYYNSDNIIENENKDYCYVNSMSYENCIIKKSLYSKFTYRQLINILCENKDGLFSQGIRIFSIDKFNFIKKSKLEISDKLIEERTV